MHLTKMEKIDKSYPKAYSSSVFEYGYDDDWLMLQLMEKLLVQENKMYHQIREAVRKRFWRFPNEEARITELAIAYGFAYMNDCCKWGGNHLNLPKFQNLLFDKTKWKEEVFIWMM